MKTTIFSEADQVAFFKAIKEINEHLHHVRHFDKVEDIEEQIKKIHSVVSFIRDRFIFIFKILNNEYKENNNNTYYDQKETAYDQFVNQTVRLFREPQETDYYIKRLFEIANVIFSNIEIGDEQFAEQARIPAKKIKEGRQEILEETIVFFEKITEWQKKRIKLFNLLQDRIPTQFQKAEAARFTVEVLFTKHKNRKENRIAYDEKKKPLSQIFLPNNFREEIIQYETFFNEINNVKEKLNDLNRERNSYKEVVRYLPFNQYPASHSSNKKRLKYESGTLREFEYYCLPRVLHILTKIIEKRISDDLFEEATKKLKKTLSEKGLFVESGNGKTAIKNFKQSLEKFWFGFNSLTNIKFKNDAAQRELTALIICKFIDNIKAEASVSEKKALDIIRNQQNKLAKNIQINLDTNIQKCINEFLRNAFVIPKFIEEFEIVNAVVLGCVDAFILWPEWGNDPVRELYQKIKDRVNIVANGDVNWNNILEAIRNTVSRWYPDELFLLKLADDCETVNFIRINHEIDRLIFDKKAPVKDTLQSSLLRFIWEFVKAWAKKELTKKVNFKALEKNEEKKFIELRNKLPGVSKGDSKWREDIRLVRQILEQCHFYGSHRQIRDLFYHLSFFLNSEENIIFDNRYYHRIGFSFIDYGIFNYHFYKEELAKDALQYIELVTNHFAEYNVALNRELPVRFDPQTVENIVLREMLTDQFKFSLSFHPVIEKHAHFISNYFNRSLIEGARYEQSLWKIRLFDQIKDDLRLLSFGEYEVLNAYLHSHTFASVSDRLQIRGGAFGIWNSLQKELVRLQDRQYCYLDYRPRKNEKWYDLSERNLTLEGWEANPLEESLDLMFFAQREQLTNPEFYQNLNKANNILNKVEKDNLCSFSEDGEISAFVLLYRFLNAMFHTRQYNTKKPESDIGQKSIGQFIYEVYNTPRDNKDEYLKKENSFQYFLQAISLMICLDPDLALEIGLYQNTKANNNCTPKELSQKRFKLLGLLFWAMDNTIIKSNQIEFIILIIISLKSLEKESGIGNITNRFIQELKKGANKKTRSRPKSTSDMLLYFFMIFKSEEDQLDMLNNDLHICSDFLKRDIKANADAYLEILPSLSAVYDIGDVEDDTREFLKNNRIENLEIIARDLIVKYFNYIQKQISNIEPVRKEGLSENQKLMVNLVRNRYQKFTLIDLFISIEKTVKNYEDLTELRQMTGQRSNQFDSTITDPALTEKVLMKTAAIKYLKIVRRLKFSIIYYLIGDSSLHNIDFFFKRMSIDDNVDQQGYDDVEVKARKEKLSNDLSQKIDASALSQTKYSGNFIAEFERQGLIQGLDKEETHIKVSERYINLCKFIEKELDPAKRAYKVRCNTTYDAFSHLNIERYFVDKKLQKNKIFLKFDRTPYFYFVRDRYLENIRAEIVDVASDHNYSTSKLEKKKFYLQATRIIVLLMESIEEKLTNDDFINIINAKPAQNNYTPEKKKQFKLLQYERAWTAMSEHIDKMSKFAIAPYFVWRANNHFAMSGLALPLVKTATVPESPNIGFLLLGIRNVFETTNGTKKHITHYTEHAFKELIYTIKSIFEPLIHPLMDKIFYEQIANKAVVENAKRAAVSRINARNLSHNLGSHVLDKLQRINIVDSEGKQTKLDLPWGSYTGGEIGNFFAYLRGRMGFIADVATGKAFFTTPYQLDVLLADLLEGYSTYQKILLDLISGTDKKADSIKIKYTNKQALNVSIPNGHYGAHALFVIIENIIRNNFKHTQVSKTLTINIACNIYRKNEKYIQLIIRDQLSKKDKSKRPRGLVNTLMKSISQKMIDPNDWQLVQENWGTLEMKIAAAYLRLIDPIEIDNYNENADDPPLLDVESVDNDLIYKIYLRIPAELEIIYDDGSSPFEEDEQKKIRTLKNLGISLIKYRSGSLVNKEILGTNYNIRVSISRNYDRDNYPYFINRNIRSYSISNQTDQQFIKRNIAELSKKIEQPLADGPTPRDLKFQNLFYRIITKVWQAYIKQVAELQNFKLKDFLIIILTQETRACITISIQSNLARPILDIFSVKNIRAKELQQKFKLLEKKKIFIFDDHGTEWRRLQNKLRTFQTEPIYYENFGSVDPLGLYLKHLGYLKVIEEVKKNIDEVTQYKRALACYELIAAGLTPIVIIDERIQKHYNHYDSVNANDKSPLDEPKKSFDKTNDRAVLAKMRIFVPGIEDVSLQDARLNLETKNNMQNWLNQITDNWKDASYKDLNFVIIHIGIIERIAGTSKKHIIDFIEEELIKNIKYSDKPPAIILTSERGTPSNLPKKYSFIPYTVIRRFLTTQASKMHLVKTLYAANMKNEATWMKK